MTSAPQFALVDVNNFYVSCERVFKPSLETQKTAFYKKNERLNENTKVENRLLQRLEMSVEKKMKV